MSDTIHVNISELREVIPQLKVGQSVLLSGTVYTSRDAAHKRICALMDEGKELPFDLNGAVIYYAGPTPTHPDGRIGSFGPTTATRMDAFAPRLLDNGLTAMIGKGGRKDAVVSAIQRNNAVYFCACGGLGALISNSIVSCEEIAFHELGCESVKRLTVRDMPVIAAILPDGSSIFDK